MEWQGLEFLGAAALISLQEIFGNPVHVANSFDSHEEAASLVRQLFLNAGVDNLIEHEAARKLVEWSERHPRAFKCAKRDIALSSVAAPVKFLGQLHSQEIVRGDPKIALEVLKKSRKSRKGHDVGGARAEREDHDRERYAHELACILKEACLPVVDHISLLDNPDKAWSRIFGARRSKTLRNRFRAWSEVRSWLVAYNAQVWPKSVSDMINFMEDNIAMGATLSLMNETQAALIRLAETLCGRLIFRHVRAKLKTEGGCATIFGGHHSVA